MCLIKWITKLFVKNEKEEKMKDMEYSPDNLAGLLGAWGSSDSIYDLNKDGIVDGADLGILLLSPPNPVPEIKDRLLYPHHGVLSSRYFNYGKLGTPDRYKLNEQLDTEEKLDISARTRYGAERYYIWYASWDTGHGSTIGNLSINTQKVIDDVRAYFGDKEPEGYGQLDYEGDFFRGLDAGKGTKENQEATKVMVSALRVMKKEFPKMKWTYYGLPILKYWLPHPSPTNSYTWVNAPDDVKQAEIDHKYDCYEELLKECDWLNPSFYNRYDPDVNKNILEREVAYRKALIRFTHLFNERQGTEKHIIPMIGPWYAPGGKAEYSNKLVQNDFFVNSTLLPYLQEDIDGLAVWYAHTYYVGLAIPNRGKTSNQAWKTAFVRNHDINESKVPWEYGDGPEEQRAEWRDELIYLSSQSILDHIVTTRNTMDKFYSS